MKYEQLKKYKRIRLLKLLAAISIDLVGSASYLLPVIGEGGDSIWGIVSGLLILGLFPNHKIMAAGGFFEEFSPGFDIIPTACILWIFDYVKNHKKTYAEFMKNEVDEALILQ